MPYIPKSSQVSDEKVRALEVAHKRVAVVQGPPYMAEGEEPAPRDAVGWQVVIRKPTAGEWKMFRRQAMNETTKEIAEETLARTCVVHVTGAPESLAPIQAFDALLEEWPALCEALSGRLGELAGVATVARGK